MKQESISNFNLYHDCCEFLVQVDSELAAGTGLGPPAGPGSGTTVDSADRRRKEDRHAKGKSRDTVTVTGRSRRYPMSESNKEESLSHSSYITQAGKASERRTVEVDIE